VIFSHNLQVNFSRTVWITFKCRDTALQVIEFRNTLTRAQELSPNFGDDLKDQAAAWA
jgi:hypothetical protein